MFHIKYKNQSFFCYFTGRLIDKQQKNTVFPMSASTPCIQLERRDFIAIQKKPKAGRVKREWDGLAWEVLG